MLGLVWAQAADRVIGNGGALPWRLPEDLARFRTLTYGSTVLMGRTTWDSLPLKARPLDGRRNVVLTRQPDWSAPGAIPVGSLTDALAAAEGDTWVIGGSQIYEAALPFGQRVVMTEVDGSFAGDVYAPPLDASWTVAAREPEDGWLCSASGLRFRVTTYERDRAAPARRGSVGP